MQASARRRFGVGRWVTQPPLRECSRMHSLPSNPGTAWVEASMLLPELLKQSLAARWTCLDLFECLPHSVQCSCLLVSRVRQETSCGP